MAPRVAKAGGVKGAAEEKGRQRAFVSFGAWRRMIRQVVMLGWQLQTRSIKFRMKSMPRADGGEAVA